MHGRLVLCLQDKQQQIDRLEEGLLAGRSAHPAAGQDGEAPAASANGAAGEDEDHQSSVVKVLCSQRDRFRSKLAEAEEEVTRAKQQLQAARSEVAAVRADNVALVERLRYIHGYQAKGAPSTCTRARTRVTGVAVPA